MLHYQNRMHIRRRRRREIFFVLTMFDHRNDCDDNNDDHRLKYRSDSSSSRSLRNWNGAVRELMQLD